MDVHTTPALDAVDVDELRCINADYRCAGVVELRMPLSGTGRPFARCDFHWEARLAAQDRINELTAPIPAGWFDSSRAGERWDEN